MLFMCSLIFTGRLDLYWRGATNLEKNKRTSRIIMINNCCFFATSVYDHREHKMFIRHRKLELPLVPFLTEICGRPQQKLQFFDLPYKFLLFWKTPCWATLFSVRSEEYLLKDKFTASRAYARERGFNKRLWTSNFARSSTSSRGNYHYNENRPNNVVTPKLLFFCEKWKINKFGHLGWNRR